MKEKELKNLAKKIAAAELAMQSCSDSSEKAKLEAEIMKLCSRAKNIEDMMLLDDMVQDILSKNF